MDDFTNDIESLFIDNDDFEPKEAITNILFIGREGEYRKFIRIIDKWSSTIMSNYSETADEAISVLLQEIFAIVILDSKGRDMDVISTSRIVHMNHPLARIVVFSRRKSASLIMDLVNQGAIDFLMILPLKEDHVFNRINE